jgi:hypothetical protein
MTREEYARNYSTSHAMDHGRSVIVPDNIQRVSESVPCFMCGMARGVCRHRRAA